MSMEHAATRARKRVANARSPMHRDVLIIGGGQCAAWCATTLRNEGFEGSLTILSEENILPYERPPLSKDVLTKGSQPSLFFSAQQYRELSIDLRLSERAVSIDRAQRRVTCQSGHRIDFETLVLATGARPRVPEVLGRNLQGVHCLRRYSDALDISNAIAKSSSSILIIGGGWIGLELASSARKLQKEVVVSEISSRLCARTLAADLSKYLLDLHRTNGVRVRFNSEIVEIHGKTRVEGVRFCDGTVLSTDTVIFGIGVTPELSLARELGLKTQTAIVTDESGATSEPNIFAGGDVAALATDRSADLLRFESWENAQNSGIRIAKRILQKPAPPVKAPWFWSDQHDHNLQLVGDVKLFDRRVELPPTADGEKVIGYFLRNKLVGAAGFNAGRKIRKIRRYLETQSGDVQELDLVDIVT